MKTTTLRGSHRRSRTRCGAYHLCTAAAAALLLLSVTLLYSRLSISSHNLLLRRHTTPSLSDRLVSDDYGDDLVSDESASLIRRGEDLIDEFDDENENDDAVGGEQEDYRRGSDEKSRAKAGADSGSDSRSGYFYDHLTGAIRRRFSRRSIDDWDDDEDGDSNLGLGFIGVGGRGGEDQSKVAIGSDDVPVDEAVRRKAVEVAGIEDVLMMKSGGARVSLRDGWGDWFDKKSDFLRRDKMFKSSFEVMNPLHNTLIQDPDGFGVTGLTRGDRLIQKLVLSEFKKVPFSMKKPLVAGVAGKGGESGDKITKVERRKALVSNAVEPKSEHESNVFADGKRWGYYPGLRSDLSFSEFVKEFLGNGKCGLRVFMVWNSPPWMFGVRYQRGLESLLYHHRDACVLVLSETIELDFFKDSFMKDGYKVAVAMPNLDELLKDTPTNVFSSVWFEWRKTKYYATHYSELVRLAVLYKYGGIYLDLDIIVLRPLSSFHNSVGMEDQIEGSPLNGAVMAFRKHSSFLMDCMKEFYMTYDDTRLRWNGADLLSRVATKFLKRKRKATSELDLKLHSSSVFFPISSQNITRYLATPTMTTNKLEEDALFEKILNESSTFHFWNSLTSSLIPEPDSLVARLIEHTCIRCSDVL